MLQKSATGTHGEVALVILLWSMILWSFPWVAELSPKKMTALINAMEEPFTVQYRIKFDWAALVNRMVDVLSVEEVLVFMMT
ncbi:MAG: hypothetical protein WCK63_19255, partial [Betaproteobacteria bacterium]